MSKATRIEAPRGAEVTFAFEGEVIRAHAGETLAAALLAHGVTAFGRMKSGAPRLPFCNMGTCFDCAVTVDGRRLVRACLTDVRDGMSVTRAEGR